MLLPAIPLFVKVLFFWGLNSKVKCGPQISIQTNDMAKIGIPVGGGAFIIWVLGKLLSPACGVAAPLCAIAW
jgi:hypothetical protein